MRKPVTDKSLEAEKERNRHRRDERLGNHINYIFVALFWVLAAGACAFYAYCIYIYGGWIGGFMQLTAEKVTVLQNIFTHSLAVGGGYLFHIVRKHVK